MSPSPLASALALLSTLAVAAPAVRAQVPVQLRCEVTDGSAAGCYYCPGFGHVVKFVGTPLASTTINLAGYHNQYVHIHGTWNGTTVTVNAIQLTTDSFTLSGNTSIGHRLRSNTMGNPGEGAINMVALGTAFSVPYLDLAFQLDPATAIVQGLGVVNGNGEFKSDLDIPNDASLVGLRLNGQGAILDAAGSLLTTNVDSKVVTP